jgi:eukaryotic-like serine/threonine-protein kinase
VARVPVGKEGVASAQPESLDAWIKEVAALPADKQVEAVGAKLKERNPGFDGKMPAAIENGVVIRLNLELGTKGLVDLSPLRGLTGLQWLGCQCPSLKDLTPLRGMKLRVLNCSHGQITDLSPLKGMPLTELWCVNTGVSDLSPLTGMPLTFLVCAGTRVTDLSPLKDLPLKQVFCDFQPDRDTAILRSIKTLETINGKPAADFWKEVDAKKGKP